MVITVLGSSWKCLWYREMLQRMLAFCRCPPRKTMKYSTSTIGECHSQLLNCNRINYEYMNRAALCIWPTTPAEAFTCGWVLLPRPWRSRTTRTRPKDNWASPSETWTTLIPLKAAASWMDSSVASDPFTISSARTNLRNWKVEVVSTSISHDTLHRIGTAVTMESPARLARGRAGKSHGPSISCCFRGSLFLSLVHVRRRQRADKERKKERKREREHLCALNNKCASTLT